MYDFEWLGDADARIVLLEAPFDPIRRQMNSVLLTIDLTKAVADEAIERKDCVVVAYRQSHFLNASKCCTDRKVPRSHNLQRSQISRPSRYATTEPVTSRARRHKRTVLVM